MFFISFACGFCLVSFLWFLFFSFVAFLPAYADDVMANASFELATRRTLTP